MQNSLDLLLNTGTTCAVLNILGNITFWKDLLMKANKGWDITYFFFFFFFFFRMKVGKLLGPVIFSLLIVLMTSRTSSDFVGVLKMYCTAFLDSFLGFALKEVSSFGAPTYWNKVIIKDFGNVFLVSNRSSIYW